MRYEVIDTRTGKVLCVFPFRSLWPGVTSRAQASHFARLNGFKYFRVRRVAAK